MAAAGEGKEKVIEHEQEEAHRRGLYPDRRKQVHPEALQTLQGPDRDAHHAGASGEACPRERARRRLGHTDR